MISSENIYFSCNQLFNIKKKFTVVDLQKHMLVLHHELHNVIFLVQYNEQYVISLLELRNSLVEEYFYSGS